MDGAQLASIAISEHKARTAVNYRRETKVIESGIQSGLTYLTTLDGVIGSRGGIPLVENGAIVGAIGCSGGTGSQDEVGAKAGAALINKGSYVERIKGRADAALSPPAQGGSARHSPEAPPRFSTRRTASIVMPRSTAFTMS